MKYFTIEEKKEIEAFVFTGTPDFQNTPSWFYMSFVRDDFKIVPCRATRKSQLMSMISGNNCEEELQGAVRGDWVCFGEKRIIFFMRDEDFHKKYQSARIPELAVDSDDKTVFSGLRNANIARQKEWDGGGELSLSFKGNELAGETGELCNVIKKLERERLGLPGSRDTVEHAAEEMADVIICVDLIANHLGVDLWQAVANKFNATSEKNGMATRLVIPNG